MARNYSTFAIAEVLHVDPGSVANWIDRDLLKAYRTPGGHRRVSAEDLVVFLRKHKMPVPPDLDSQPRRVLVVDDEPAVTKPLVRAIRDAYPRLEVSEANDGFQAGRLVATLKPDIVVLDLRMKGLDGYDICRTIKSCQETRHARVIAVAPNASAETEKRAIESGAAACVSKPLDMGRLLEQIAAAL